MSDCWRIHLWIWLSGLTGGYRLDLSFIHSTTKFGNCSFSMAGSTTWNILQELIKLSIYIFNPLAAEFVIPFRAHGDKFLQTLTWHGLFSMFTVWTDFFLCYSCFLGWELKLCLYLQYRVSVYTLFLKRRTRKFIFRSYVLNVIKINISFFLSNVGSPGVDLSTSCA